MNVDEIMPVLGEEWDLVAHSLICTPIRVCRKTNYVQTLDIKHLMTGPKGNSEFCFPETSMFSIEVRGETKLTVSRGASH